MKERIEKIEKKEKNIEIFGKNLSYVCVCCCVCIDLCARLIGLDKNKIEVEGTSSVSVE